MEERIEYTDWCKWCDRPTTWIGRSDIDTQRTYTVCSHCFNEQGTGPRKVGSKMVELLSMTALMSGGMIDYTDYDRIMPVHSKSGRRSSGGYKKSSLLSRASGRPRKDGEDLTSGFRAEAKPGRNDPCSCGSGKKYKKCCIGK